MTLIEQVGTQLDSELTSFNTIGKAWTSKPVANMNTALPAAFYYLDGIESQPSPYMNETVQPGDYSVAVLLICAVDDIEDMLLELRAALAGFQPSGGSWDPFEHVNGSTLEINESVIWWKEVFAARNYQT